MNQRHLFFWAVRLPGRLARRYLGKAGAASAQVRSGSEWTWSLTQEQLNALYQYLSHHQNRPIIKALGYQYGIPFVLSGSLLAPPLGWLVFLLGLPFSMWFEWRGERMVADLLTQGKLSQTSGPLARVTAMVALWESAELHQGLRMAEEYNRLLDELDLPAGAVPAGLSLKIPLGHTWVQVINHALNVRNRYRERLIGRFISLLGFISRLMPLRLLRWVFVTWAIGLQAMLLFRHREELNALLSGASNPEVARQAS